MAVTSVQQILDQHARLLERVASQAAGALKGHIPDDLVVAQKKQRIEQLRQRVEDLKSNRARTLERLDREIQVREDEIARLERELKEDAEKRSPRGGGAPGGPRRPTGLREIAGVGEALEARLGELGIRTPEQLAKRDAKDLAAGLGISEKRADGLIAAAKEIVRPTTDRRRR